MYLNGKRLSIGADFECHLNKDLNSPITWQKMSQSQSSIWIHANPWIPVCTGNEMRCFYDIHSFGLTGNWIALLAHRLRNTISRFSLLLVPPLMIVCFTLTHSYHTIVFSFIIVTVLTRNKHFIHSNGPQQFIRWMVQYSSQVLNRKLIVCYSNGKKFGDGMAFGFRTFYHGC